MEVSFNKKVVVCLQCRYFATKVDQIVTPVVSLHQNTVLYLCQACGLRNVYPKHQSVVRLPQTAYLKVPYSSLLKDSNTSNKKHIYLVVIEHGKPQDIAFMLPTKSTLLQQKFKLDFSLIQNAPSLEQKSPWMKQFRERKKALLKFNKPQLPKHNTVFRDQYVIYLLEKYIQKEQQEGRTNMEVNIAVKTQNMVFYFGIREFKISDKNTVLSHFIQIYALIANDFQPSWTHSFYSTLIDEYHKKIIDLDQISSDQIIHFDLSGDGQVKQVKNPNKNYFQQIQALFFRKQDNSNKTLQLRLQEYDLDPFSPNSFQKYLIKTKQSQSFKEEITVFWKQRRSKKIESNKIQQNIQKLKSILLNNKNHQISIEETELKKVVLQYLQCFKHQKVIYPFKLTSFLSEQNGSGRYIVLYTFNWTTVQQQKIFESLEEPTNYLTIFKQDIIGNHPKAKASNPFSKKTKKHLESGVVYRQESDNQDNMISL